ncbi:sigma factor-like helix-turn-helix DNA-binding protein [Solihabitans fulvus]|nr:sigma factor-like helix-turn-helix DNA-binding protein [Solihabitans fulvus]
MSSTALVPFEDFFTQWRHPLVRFLVQKGASWFDAEDAVQLVLMKTFSRATQVRNRGAYLRRAAMYTLSAMKKCQLRDQIRAENWTGRPRELSAADICHRDREIDTVRELLAILPQRQRQVVAGLYDGYQPNEIADALGASPATVRSNRRHARRTLEPFTVGGDRESRRWMRSGERIYDAFHRGEPLPLLPRPVIDRAWRVAKYLQLDPERGVEMETPSPDEVMHRRRTSQLATHSWVLSAMTALAEATGQMMVVVDGDGVVLWRDGDRRTQDAAEKLGFVAGARWDIRHAGVNGIALALMTRRTMAVSRWEHSVQTQHDLACVAVPVLDPWDGRVSCVLNLTGTQTTVPQAIRRQVDTIGLRLHQELTRTVGQPARNGGSGRLSCSGTQRPSSLR